MKTKSSNPIERIIEVALLSAGIAFITDRERTSPARLDFYLPEYDVHVEVKAFGSERTNEQMRRAQNVIVVQGEASARLFASAILGLATQKVGEIGCAQ